MNIRLGVIGLGNMGAAIVRGLAGREDVTLFGMDADQAKMDELAQEVGLTPCPTLFKIIEEAQYLVVAVKPHQVQAVLKDSCTRLTPAHVVVSIAAGVGLETLKNHVCGACPVVRVMPNTPAMVRAGVFALCLEDPMLKDEHREFVTELFKPLGQAHVLPESLFDAFTAVVGSGPAYVFYFMEALMEAAVTLGFTRGQAQEVVRGLFSGSAALAEQSGKHVSLLREMVTSPAGTTITALNHLDRQAVRAAIIDAVAAACRRSKELG